MDFIIPHGKNGVEYNENAQQFEVSIYLDI